MPTRNFDQRAQFMPADENKGENITFLIDRGEDVMTAQYEAAVQQAAETHPGSERFIYRPTFLGKQLESRDGIDFNLADPGAALGDRLIWTTFFRAFDVLSQLYADKFRPGELPPLQNTLYITPEILPLFERDGRTVSSLITGAPQSPRTSGRLSFVAHYSMSAMGAAHARMVGNEGRFLSYRQFDLPDQKNSLEVEYGGALATATYDKYGPKRYTIAAALALGIPEGEWDSLPTIVPEVLTPHDDEYRQTIERFGVNNEAINIGIVINSQLRVKMATLEVWKHIMFATGLGIFRKQLNPNQRPIHFNVFYNPSSPSRDDYKVEEMQAMFQDRITYISPKSDNETVGEVKYIGANLAELPALLEAQDVLLSVDTALAHIGAALEFGPEVIMMFNNSQFSQQEWQSSSKQHPVPMTGGYSDQVANLALQHLRLKA